MTNMPDHAAAADLPGASAGVITHTYIRLRGTQQFDDIDVHHARTKIARVTLRWAGVLMSFLNAEAAQGVLEGFSAARHSLARVPADIAPRDQQPYDGPAIAVDWTRRPPYAVSSRQALTPDKRRTVHWAEVYMRPVTFQIVDVAAFRSAVEVLRLAHKTAVAVCRDGQQYRFDPTADAYRPQR
jgi:hypothetical protein